jgi:hypothetical protein
LPAEPTCPDSIQDQGDNAPRVYNARFFFWKPPLDAEVGSYTFRSVWLVDPAVRRTVRIDVN